MSDNNRLSFTGPLDDSRTEILPSVDGTGYDDAVKLTGGLKNFVLVVGLLTGGREDCVDVNNRAHQIVVRAGKFIPKGRYVATVKGGASSILLAGTIDGDASEVDVDLGNWSDQSHDYVGSVLLDLRKESGRPVTVRVLAADAPLLHPGSGPYRFAFPQPWLPFHPTIVRVFRELRRWGLFR